MTTIQKLTLGLGIIVLLAFIPTSGVDATSASCQVTSTYPGFEWLDTSVCSCTAYRNRESSGWSKDGWQVPEYGNACEKLCSDLWACIDAEKKPAPTSVSILDQLSPDDPPDEPLPDDPAYQFCLPPEDDSVGSLINPNDKTSLLGFLYPLFPTANAQISSNHSIITKIEGEVLIKTKNAPRWAPAFKGQRIMVGDKIKTGRTGRCNVKFANSANFRMRGLSQLEIPNQSREQCRINKRVGYLDMRFGNIWENVATKGRDIVIYTPMGSTGIRDTSLGHLIGETPSKYQPHPIFENLFTSIAQAAGTEPIVHVRHDDVTNISEFYVEQGLVYVHDVNQTTTLPLQAGEHITLEPGRIPKVADVILGEQVVAPWWESSINNKLGYINLLYFIAGLGITITIARKMKKRGIIIKTIVVIAGIFITIVIIGFLNADLLTYLFSD